MTDEQVRVLLEDKIQGAEARACLQRDDPLVIIPGPIARF
jgi:hypothetical protein